LRTDAASRGIAISRFTLERIFLSLSIWFFSFIVSPLV
jgi:hypothetical protein